MNTVQVQNHLRALGWTHLITDGDYGPRTKKAVENFQFGYVYQHLTVDGKAGPVTQRALRESLRNMRSGKGSASEHFHFVEFMCKCGGRYKACERIKIDRVLILGLEELRDEMGFGFSPVSGFRCYSHNKAVGGAKESQHRYGKACDTPPVLSRSRVIQLRRFTGIGYNARSGKVAHVDVRPGSVHRPVDWEYSR